MESKEADITTVVPDTLESLETELQRLLERAEDCKSKEAFNNAELKSKLSQVLTDMTGEVTPESLNALIELVRAIFQVDATLPKLFELVIQQLPSQTKALARTPVLAKLVEEFKPTPDDWRQLYSLLTGQKAMKKSTLLKLLEQSGKSTSLHNSKPVKLSFDKLLKVMAYYVPAVNPELSFLTDLWNKRVVVGRPVKRADLLSDRQNFIAPIVKAPGYTLLDIEVLAKYISIDMEKVAELVWKHRPAQFNEFALTHKVYKKVEIAAIIANNANIMSVELLGKCLTGTNLRNSLLKPVECIEAFMALDDAIVWNNKDLIDLYVKYIMPKNGIFEAAYLRYLTGKLSATKMAHIVQEVKRNNQYMPVLMIMGQVANQRDDSEVLIALCKNFNLASYRPDLCISKLDQFKVKMPNQISMKTYMIKSLLYDKPEKQQQLINYIFEPISAELDLDPAANISQWTAMAELMQMLVDSKLELSDSIFANFRTSTVVPALPMLSPEALTDD
jgi:hypothetical protein